MSSRQIEKTSQPGEASAKKRDLRQELIDAGLAILTEDGLEGLTLRRVAARAGVSHAAPAHHFYGLPQLLGRISAVGFRMLTETSREKFANAAKDPREQLIAVCDGYIEFATANPGLMQLMFNAKIGEVDVEEFQEDARESYAELRRACAPFAAVGKASDSTETFIWSLVHGLALLQIADRFDNPSRVTTAPNVRDILPELPLANPTN